MFGDKVNIDVIAMVAGVVLFIVWLIRLEGRVQSIKSRQAVSERNNHERFDKGEKSVEKLTDKHNDLERRIAEDLSIVKSTLARIEGRLSRRNTN